MSIHVTQRLTGRTEPTDAGQDEEGEEGNTEDVILDNMHGFEGTEGGGNEMDVEDVNNRENNADDADGDDETQLAENLVQNDDGNGGDEIMSKISTSTLTTSMFKMALMTTTRQEMKLMKTQDD